MAALLTAGAQAQPARPRDAVPSAPGESLPISAGPIPRELAKGAEVIFVSGYEPGPSTVARVFLDRPDRKVVLILSSYSKTLWRIEPVSGTQLVAIGVNSFEPGSTVWTSGATKAYHVDVPYVTQVDNAKFRQAAGILGALLGASRIDAFRRLRPDS